jgi:excisionase family DNA binding protein
MEEEAMRENIFPPWVNARTHLTRKEAAEYLGMSPKTLENHPKHIPFYKFGGRVFYIKEELDTLIRRNRQEGVQ